ncbi:MAG: recombinase family protein [Lachnospiraceae bacterium]|nr:recombinase family protein [Lachnospiraceae bacterium]
MKEIISINNQIRWETEEKERAVIYCRCSTEEESQKNALEQQIEEACQCAEQMGWELLNQYVESKSATSTYGRFEYQKLYEDLETDYFDIIIIKSVDRLMRNVKDWYLFLDRMVQNRKKLYLYLERKFYMPKDSLIIGIKAILAEDYSRELSKKINNAHYHRQQTGRNLILTNRTYGYKKMPDKTVEIDVKEAPMIERIYQLAANGLGCKRIANELYREEYRNRNGNRISDASILRMIRNPLYKGTVVMNKKHYDFERKMLINLPKEQWIVHENRVPAIISKELWERANRSVDERGKTANQNTFQDSKTDFSFQRSTNREKPIFSGKIRCGLCKAPYYRTYYDKKEKDGKETRVIQWKCNTYLSYGRKSIQYQKPKLWKGKTADEKEGCDNLHLPEEYLKKILYKNREKYDMPVYEEQKRLRIKMVELLRTVLLEETKNSWKWESQKTALEQKEKELEQKQEILLDCLLDQTISKEKYVVRQNQLERQKIKVREQLQEQYHQVVPSKIKINQENRKDTITVEDRLENRLKKIDLCMKDSIMEQVIVEQMIKKTERIEVYPQYLLLYMNQNREQQKRRNQEINLFSAPISIGIKNQGIQAKKEEERKEILSIIEETPTITARQIALLTGQSLSAVEYKIRRLKKDGWVHFEGKGGWGKWVVTRCPHSESQKLLQEERPGWNK